MELWTLFVTAFIVGFSGALMPGPVLAVAIAETPRRGPYTGSIITIGHAIAEIVVVVILTLGISSFADNDKISNMIGVVGGAMLLIMGFSMLYDVLKSKVKTSSATQSGKSSSRLILDGVLTSLSNPYWYVWWATTGSAFLVRAIRHGTIGPSIFYIGHILSDLVWYTLVSVLIWKGRKLIVGLGYKILISLCALFLLYLGGLFIYDGLTGGI